MLRGGEGEQEALEQAKQKLQDAEAALAVATAAEPQSGDDVQTATEAVRAATEAVRAAEEEAVRAAEEAVRAASVPSNGAAAAAAVVPSSQPNAAPAIVAVKNAIENLKAILDDATSTNSSERQKQEAVQTFFRPIDIKSKNNEIQKIVNNNQMNNQEKAIKIFNVVAADKNYSEHLYALLGLGGTAAAYMFGRSHGKKSQQKKHKAHAKGS